LKIVKLKTETEMEVTMLSKRKMLVSNGDGTLLETKDLNEVVELILEEIPDVAECHILEFLRKNNCQNGIRLHGFSEEEALKFNRRLCSFFYRDNNPCGEEMREEY